MHLGTPVVPDEYRRFGLGCTLYGIGDPVSSALTESLSDGKNEPLARAKVVDKLAQYYPSADLKQSSLVVILSTLAGVIEFGVLGLILGPLVASCAIGLMNFYIQTKLNSESQTDS